MKSEQVLRHYNPHLPIRISCDASPFGLGAVLSQVCASIEERPIAFAIRTLNSAENNYSQTDKEALGIVWGIKHFQMYLYGRHFSLITDHKPLVSIFHPISVYHLLQLQGYNGMPCSYPGLITLLNIGTRKNTEMLMDFHDFR